jgi:hypothetical protein
VRGTRSIPHRVIGRASADLEGDRWPTSREDQLFPTEALTETVEMTSCRACFLLDIPSQAAILNHCLFRCPGAGRPLVGAARRPFIVP